MPMRSASSAARFDGRVVVSNAVTGASVHTFAHEFFVFSVSIDATRVLIAGGNTLRLWDLDSGALLTALQVHDAATHAYAELLGDTDIVACVGESGIVRFWNFAAGVCVGDCAALADMASAMAASRDGRLLAVATAYGSVTLIDCTNRTVLWRVFALEEWIRDLRVTQGAVFCVAQDGQFAALDIQTGTLLTKRRIDAAIAALAGQVDQEDFCAVDTRGAVHSIPQ
jgi:WD40 repeat protein